MIGVPVAERSPSTSRTLDAFRARAGGAAAADASAPGSVTPADLNESLLEPHEALRLRRRDVRLVRRRRCVVVDVSGSLRMRRSW